MSVRQAVIKTRIVWWCLEHHGEGVGPIGDGPKPQGLGEPFCWFAAYLKEVGDESPGVCRMVPAKVTAVDDLDVLLDLAAEKMEL